MLERELENTGNFVSSSSSSLRDGARARGSFRLISSAMAKNMFVV